jgi:glycosyltransferase involved in cell wall biosynthesis
MKILYVMRNIWGGGAPRRFWDIHYLLAQRGFEITLLATPDASTYQKFDQSRFPNIRIIPLRLSSHFPDYIFYLKAATIVRQIHKNFDIIHDDFSPFSPYSFLWKENTIATVHEVFRNAILRYGVVGLAPILNQKMYSKMGYKAFITPSLSTSRELNKIKTKSLIVPNGVNTDLFKPNDDLRKKDSINISMVSRFIPIKGHYSFLKVARILSKTYKDINFILPSTGPILPKIKNIADQLDFSISFPGFLESDEKISRILMKSNVYVNTSFQEGFGISVCNAMSAGLPIVAFDVSGIRDLVTPECGFLIPLGDIDKMVGKIKILIEDGNLRKKMGLCSRERVTKFFSLDIAAKKMYDVYKNII